MQFLIKWKESGEEEVQTFGTLQAGERASDQPNDDQIFYWLTPEESLAIGADYDGGEWIVIRCACEECWEWCSNCEVEESHLTDMECLAYENEREGASA